MHFITENIDDVPFCIAKWPCENAFWHQAIISASRKCVAEHFCTAKM